MINSEIIILDQHNHLKIIVNYILRVLTNDVLANKQQTIELAATYTSSQAANETGLAYNEDNESN